MLTDTAPASTTVYTAAEVADILRINVKSVRHLCTSGRIAAVKAGREWRIPREALQAFLQTPPPPRSKDGDRNMIRRDYFAEYKRQERRIRRIPELDRATHVLRDVRRAARDISSAKWASMWQGELAKKAKADYARHKANITRKRLLKLRRFHVNHLARALRYCRVPLVSSVEETT